MPALHQPVASAFPQHPLEIAEVARQALLHEVRRAALRRGLLVLVVERCAQGMMGVVHLVDQIGDRELELERVQLADLVAGREPVSPPEEVTDRGRLREDQLAVLQHGRREDRMSRALSRIERDHRLDAAALFSGPPADVDVGSPRLLEHQAHELTAPGNVRPVVELVGNRHGGSDRGGSDQRTARRQAGRCGNSHRARDLNG